MVAISSAFQPAPHPTTTQPLDRRSSVANCLAVTIGSRCAIRMIKVPSLIRLVTLVRRRQRHNRTVSVVKVRVIIGAAGILGLLADRNVGMFADVNASSPCSSIARASSAGCIEYSVANMLIPNRAMAQALFRIAGSAPILFGEVDQNRPLPARDRIHPRSSTRIDR